MSKNLELAPVLEQHLPFLRRYARALTGSQKDGDQFSLLTLQAILADRTIFDSALAPKTALFRVFHTIWDPSRTTDHTYENPLDAKAHEKLSKLTPRTREALLLKMLEAFPVAEIGEILEIPTKEAEELVAVGTDEMRSEISSRVMIIEDEPIIAMDIEAIVTGMGHSVVGVARTETEATKMSAETDFDLLLADIQLADGSSGIDAVKTILGEKADLPVIFITAFPDRLLTGERPEPTYLITKPFDEEQVRSSTSQALFFASAQAIH